MSIAAHSHACKRKEGEARLTDTDIAHLEADRKISRQASLKMRLDELVCTRDIAQQLLDCGLSTPSFFCWSKDGVVPTSQPSGGSNSLAAYTSDELGQLIKIAQFSWKSGLAPHIETYYSDKIDKFVCKIRAGHPLPKSKEKESRELPPDEKAVDEADAVLQFQADTESNARAQLLVYLLQNGMFSKEEIPAQKAEQASEKEVSKS